MRTIDVTTKFQHMKVDMTIIGQFALHVNGYGPVMKIVGHDIDNVLNLRYKCEWKENCRVTSALFKRSELDLFCEIELAVNKQKIKKPLKSPVEIKKESSAIFLDDLGNTVKPYTEQELTRIYSDIN